MTTRRVNRRFTSDWREVIFRLRCSIGRTAQTSIFQYCELMLASLTLEISIVTRTQMIKPNFLSHHPISQTQLAKDP